MRKTIKIVAGVVFTIGATFAGTAAASAGEYQVGETETAGDPCGEDAPYGLTVPAWLLAYYG